MSLKDWPLRAGLAAGAALGVGAAVVAPAVFRIARPGIKTALKAGFAGVTAAQAALLRAGEHVEDLLAEVAHELAQEEQHAAAGVAATAAASAGAVAAAARTGSADEGQQPPAANG
jgi:hypothetical protein